MAIKPIENPSTPWHTSTGPDLTNYIPVCCESQIRPLEKNLFDPSLWSQLTSQGAVRHHTNLIAQEFKPGYLFVQQGLEGSIIHWTTKEDQTIHRASLFEDKILVCSYKLNGSSSPSRAELTPDEFKTAIHKYISLNPQKPELGAPSSEWLDFQRQLELMPISVKISDAAARKFLELRAQYPEEKDATVAIFFNVKKAKADDDKPLSDLAIINISSRFLINRLAITQLEGSKSSVTLHASPTIRSWEAYAKAEELSPALGKLDNERKIADLSNEAGPKYFKGQDLRPELMLKVKGQSSIQRFKHQLVEGKHGFDLSIDSNESGWILNSTYSRPIKAKQVTEERGT
jgi:hypothetical protein